MGMGIPMGKSYRLLRLFVRNRLGIRIRIWERREIRILERMVIEIAIGTTQKVSPMETMINQNK